MTRRKPAIEDWSGPAAMIGGGLWVAGTLAHAARPRGCVGDECATRPMRESSAVEGVLTLAALLLIATGALGLVLLTRRAGRLGPAGRWGAALGAAGFAVVAVASIVQAALFAGDFPLMPFFVVPGLVALVVGVALVAAAVLRAGVLPRWSAAGLVVGALAMLGFNEQTAAALLAVPFGLAWVGVGWALWSRRPA